MKILLSFLLFKISVFAQLKEIDSSNFNFTKPEVGNYLIFRDISNCRLGSINRTDKDKILSYLITLLSNTNFILQIENHTDCRANEDFNKYRSNMIANSCRRFFLLKGIDSSQIIAKGMGEDSLLLKKCDCDLIDTKNKCTEYEHQLNQRTILRIIGRKEE